MSKISWNNQQFIDDYAISPTCFVLRHFLNVYEFEPEDSVLIIGAFESSSHPILRTRTMAGKVIAVHTSDPTRQTGLNKFNFIKDSVHKLKMEPDEWDSILCLSALQYVGRGVFPGDSQTENADRKLLSKLKNGLKKGGKVYMSVPVGKYDSPVSKVYNKSDLRELIPPGLKIVSKFYLSSAYFKSGGLNDDVIQVKEDAALACEEAHCECFFILEK